MGFILGPGALIQLQHAALYACLSDTGMLYSIPMEHSLSVFLGKRCLSTVLWGIFVSFKILYKYNLYICEGFCITVHLLKKNGTLKNREGEEKGKEKMYLVMSCWVLTPPLIMLDDKMH